MVQKEVIEVLTICRAMSTTVIKKTILRVPYTPFSVRSKTSGGHRVHTGSIEFLKGEQYLSVTVCKEGSLNTHHREEGCQRFPFGINAASHGREKTSFAASARR